MKGIEKNVHAFLFNYAPSQKSLYEFTIELINPVHKSKVTKDKQAASKWASSGYSQ